MRTILTQSLLVFLLVISCKIHSQGTLNYSVQVYDNNQKPISGLEVVLIETSSFKRTVYQTDIHGKATFILTEEDGSDWMMNIGEMYDYRRLSISPGSTGSGSATTTYDVERWNRQNEIPLDRTNMYLEDIPQRIDYNVRPGLSEELVEIQVVSKGGSAFYNVPVKMTSYALGVSYSAYTDEQGIARFLLPLNEKFQLDLDGENDFSFHDTGSEPMINRLTITYEKINFREEENEAGYLEQTFIEKPRPVSNRVLVLLKVSGGPNDGVNEPVYVQMDYSAKKYMTYTNENGYAIFLLPKQKTYHVNFQFQQDADVIDLSQFFGIGYKEQTVVYDPDPRLQFPENYLPKPDDVKSYDINNYMTKRYADTPDDELVNVHVQWGNNKINSGSKEALLELGFSIKQPIEKPALSTPLNVAFVLDKSGSMSGDKIDLLKTAMLNFVEKLRPEDRISIVYFDTEAVVAYNETKFDKNHVQDVIRAVQADGGTSILAGLELGYEAVEKNRTDNSVNRVILLTDGYGEDPVDYILEKSEAYFKKGISVSTIGVGEDYNHSLMELLSKYSGGMVHQAITSDLIAIALEEEFESLLYPLASDLSVKVFYNDRVIYKTIVGVPEKNKTDHSVEFELPKVFSSMNKMVLMKFKIENPDRDFDKNKIRIEINYFDETKKLPVSIIKETALEWTDETDIELIQDNHLKKVYSIAVINQAMKVIADYCVASKYTDAKELINQTLRSLKEITDETYDADLIPIIEELKSLLTYLDRAIAKG